MNIHLRPTKKKAKKRAPRLRLQRAFLQVFISKENSSGHFAGEEKISWWQLGQQKTGPGVV